jgi:hypothetical protein
VNIVDESLLKIMHDGGAEGISLGVESGSQMITRAKAFSQSLVFLVTMKSTVKLTIVRTARLANCD